METQDPPRRRRGPAPYGADEKRSYTVSVRLNGAEEAQLDLARSKVGMQRGEYLRTVALGEQPQAIPELNRSAWSALARTAGSIDRIAERLCANGKLDAIETRAALSAFRLEVIGARASTR